MFALLACAVAGAACSREQMARQAEARAEKWGIPAVRITRDVVYAEYGSRRLRLDVYRPPESADERQLPGIVVVYRTVYEARFPAAIHDVKAAALAAASPARHVTRRSAPLLLLHSTTDPVAPFARAVDMEQAYRRAGARVTLKAIEAANLHGFWSDRRYFGEARREALEFFHRRLTARQ